MRKLLFALLGVAALIGVPVAYAAGLFPGLPTVQPAGTTGSVTVNGVTIPQSGYTVLPLTGSETIPADTNLSSGRTPQTEAITVHQLHSYVRAPVALTSAASLAINAMLGDFFTHTIAAAQSLATPTNLQSGQVFRIRVIQDATGSRVLTTANVPIYKWTGLTTPGAILTTTAAAADMITCAYDGTFVLCSPQRDYVLFNGTRPASP